MQLVLKTQFEAMSRYEHVNEKKLLEHIIDSFTLGKVKGKTEIEFDICHLKVPENAVPSQHTSRSDSEPNIITLSYVLRLTATPGLFIKKCHLILLEFSKGSKQKFHYS